MYWWTHGKPIDETIWHRCSLFWWPFRINGRLDITGEVWCRKIGGKWEYALYEGDDPNVPNNDPTATYW